MIALACSGACTAGVAPRDEPGLGELPSAQAESVSFDPQGDGSGMRDGCGSRFAATDVAGFVQEWFGVVAGLQPSVDANPVRQRIADPEGTRIEEARSVQLCSAQVMDSYGASTDRRIAELSRSMAALLADVAEAERRNAALFRGTDWNAEGSIEGRARLWSEIRPSMASLSGRGAELTERIVALVREDGRASYGPGRLRISRDGRAVALRDRGRLTDLTIMVERGIDPGGPLSVTARKVLKWLHHAHGLTYAEPGPSTGLDLPRPAG